MALYAIADLHLSFSANKPMDIYGPAWSNHAARVKEAWLSLVEPQDTVIIAGDISWGLRLEEAMADLAWIHELPGRKVLVKGNHDPWWASIGRLNALFEDMFFLQNSFFPFGEYAICGSRGWVCPGSSDFTRHDEKIYKRELLRMKASFEAAVKAGYEKFVGVMHYPPMNEKKEPSGFTEIFAYYDVHKAVYGHLHGDSARSAPRGLIGGTDYMLAACDALNCRPVRVL